MPQHKVRAPLDFHGLRAELGLPAEFPPEVLADAEAAQPSLPDNDETAIPFVTIDPPGSKDLDQAVCIERDGSGFVVHYAIADVAAFVTPGSALDEEANRRGETVYFPDARVPLHPPVLSEGRASLLPDQTAPAVLWRIELDEKGEVRGVDVGRALVRSRAQLTYEGVQRGDGHESIEALKDVGERRIALARERHAIELDLPAQEVEKDGDGWKLQFRSPLPVEQYNAQISLLTGMCAAKIMLDGGFGVLRTVPPPQDGAVRALRRIAHELGINWPDGTHPGDVLSTLNRANPHHVVFLDHAGSLLRGSAYTFFEGAPPEQPLHAGVAAAYTHVTAPLRRLVDRYSSEICLALTAKQPVPDWVQQRARGLPDTMKDSNGRAHEADRAVLDLTEAWLLAERVGQEFPAVVLDRDDHAATIAVDDPAVRARCAGDGLEIGQHITARLVEADLATRKVRFERA